MVDPLTFFDDLYSRYQTAVDASGGRIDRFYEIGGLAIELQFAGVGLIPYITRAFSHLEIEPAIDPSLTICLWDSSSTNTSTIIPPWQMPGDRGEVRGFIGDRFHSSWQPEYSALSILDLERNLAIYWINNSHQLPYWETGAPLRTILDIWFSQRNIQLLHAAAVGTSEGGVLLVGKSGSGKSTIALSCLRSSFGYASDDYTLVNLNPIPTVFSIYNTGKKNADDLDRLPFLKGFTSNPERLETEKAIYFINELFPNKIISRFPLKAILIPRITGNKLTSWQPASSVDTLLALAPSTIFQLRQAGNRALQIMKTLVQQVDCYHLEVGTDIEHISETIARLLT